MENCIAFGLKCGIVGGTDGRYIVLDNIGAKPPVEPVFFNTLLG